MWQQIKGQTLGNTWRWWSHTTNTVVNSAFPICITGGAGEAAEMCNMATSVLEWQGLCALTCTSGPRGFRKCMPVPGHAQHKPHSTESRSGLLIVRDHIVMHGLGKKLRSEKDQKTMSSAPQDLSHLVYSSFQVPRQ